MKLYNGTRYYVETWNRAKAMRLRIFESRNANVPRHVAIGENAEQLDRVLENLRGREEIDAWCEKFLASRNDHIPPPME